MENSQPVDNAALSPQELQAANMEKVQILAKEGLGIPDQHIILMKVDGLIDALAGELGEDVRQEAAYRFDLRLATILENAVAELPRMKLMAPGQPPGGPGLLRAP